MLITNDMNKYINWYISMNNISGIPEDYNIKRHFDELKKKQPIASDLKRSYRNFFNMIEAVYKKGNSRWGKLSFDIIHFKDAINDEVEKINEKTETTSEKIEIHEIKPITI